MGGRSISWYRPTDSLSIPPAEIAADRSTWVDGWTQLVEH